MRFGHQKCFYTNFEEKKNQVFRFFFFFSLFRFPLFSQTRYKIVSNFKSEKRNDIDWFAQKFFKIFRVF